ncbi:transcriptional regulator, TetR family [Desulfatibacillum alkenivorans DSM 16219]|jgi:AcrR family transcriptional regulator|uniref:Transcriptional regulator, TetR family n=1 Tax=Desulfatibacillum alkenivorans DSM 16219 TaxID=1121393 RepID=A0A1M6I7C1_9BACT|nr:TetR/AcrR family transcriptional regulator [Desulfatibacillum alkenivorans]SHJ30308.1 transcriptional regulator, TetR family [Desulfatibacillum alkenivorans DSM 16219]
MQSKSKDKTPGPSRRERQRKERRQAILQAAENLFAEQGYRKTRIEDIAGKADVSVGTVYGYFKNKEDLLMSVLEDIGMFVRRLVGSEFRKAATTLEGIRLAGMAFFEVLCVHHNEKLALFYDERIGNSEQFQRARKVWSIQMIEDVKGAILVVQEASGMEFRSSMSAEIMGVCTVGIFDRLGYFYQLSQIDPETLKTVGEETVAFVVGGIQSLITREGGKLG